MNFKECVCVKQISGRFEYIVWLPEQFAIVGKHLKFKSYYVSSVYTTNWVVEQVSTEVMTEEQIKQSKLNYKCFPEVCDD